MTIPMLFIEEFGVKLDSEHRPVGVLHRLNRAGFVEGRAAKACGQFFDFVEVGMPDDYAKGQLPKEPSAIRLDFEKASLAFGSFVSMSRFETSHQANRSTKSERNLLVAAAYAKEWLRRVVNYLEDSGKQPCRVLIPGMALAAQDNVRGLELLYAG